MSEAARATAAELLAVVVEPLAALAVGEEAVAGSTLGRALERRLQTETWKRPNYSRRFGKHLYSVVWCSLLWRATFAVGIWTAMDGVGSSPGAEGCMAGGCMGLKAPCENIHKTKDEKPLQNSSSHVF